MADKFFTPGGMIGMSPYVSLVCILMFVGYSDAMRGRMRGMRVNAADPQQAAAADPGVNEAALQLVMTANDPCLNFTANQAVPENDNANLTCRRAVAAFNARDEAARERCRFAVEPKCRSVRGAGLQRCSIKKLRPRSHFVCLIARRSFEVEAMIHCAAPLFPGLPVVQQQPLQPIFV